MQSHTVSDHEVVFLMNESTARKRSASTENPCVACARPLPPGHDFCKAKHLAESEHGLRHALRVSRRHEVAATPERPQSRKRRPSPSSDFRPSCGGSLQKRSRKQPEPERAPFC
nr:unnamed protein product [Digitaria exilis]